MRFPIILLLCLSFSSAYADENIFFVKMPTNVTVPQAVSIVSEAAMKRKWRVTDSGSDQLQIKLNHRDYKAVLDFSFSEYKITYKDSTTYFDSFAGGRFPADWPKREPEEMPVPSKWINNIKKDVRTAFSLAENKNYSDNTNRPSSERRSNVGQESSQDSIVTKLENLKILLDKKLITEADYNSKKKEIMSRY